MAYGDEQTGAIRMVAFGVLQYVPAPANFSGPLDIYNKSVEEAHQIERLVVREIATLGWKLSNSVDRWRGKHNGKFILLGPITQTTALVVRPKIGEGTLQEVCRNAVNYLETGKPDTARVYAE